MENIRDNLAKKHPNIYYILNKFKKKWKMDGEYNVKRTDDKQDKRAGRRVKKDHMGETFPSASLILSLFPDVTFSFSFILLSLTYFQLQRN